MFLLLILLVFPIHLFSVQQPSSFVHGRQFDLECNLCHVTDSWKVNPQKVIFNHNSTGFRLLGAHRQVDCQECHHSLVFSKIGHNCIDCHQDIHEGQFGIDCERCHSPKSWENRFEVFELHQSTRFPLLGVHAVVDCQSCHHEPNKMDFKMKGVECKDCHLATFVGTLNPAHQKAGFSLQCEKCHLTNAVSWKQTMYEHSTKFPLTGAHNTLDCIGCHNSRYQGLPVECFGCHQSQFQNASNPDHKAFGFPTNCEECHSTQNWIRSQFDHLAASGFALQGAHGQSDRVKCVDCHVGNQIQGLPRDCFGCHQINFNQTRDPDHVNGNFPHDCLTCHNQQAWSPAEFDHNRTNFPLTGAHSRVACADCHQNGYSNTSLACVSCHQQNYDNTANPDHQAANFPNTCEDCHSTTAWQPANWDHDAQYFPIYSGKHNGEWQVCADCHVNSADFSQFECINCHEHNQSKMDAEHNEVTNYVYDSKACYDCHPQGNKGDD